MTSDCYPAPSSIHGTGEFASHEIKKGDLIVVGRDCEGFNWSVDSNVAVVVDTDRLIGMNFFERWLYEIIFTKTIATRDIKKDEELTLPFPDEKTRRQLTR